MPIKPENKKLYPSDWKQIRQRIRNRASDKCELCGIPNHAYVNKHTREICTRDEDDVIRIVCTVMHLDHDPTNNKDSNLKFGCQKCHNSYDAPHRAKTRERTRQEKLRDSGQGVLNYPLMMTECYATINNP